MPDNNPDPGWYFCTKHNRVEHGEVCPAIDRMGPYPDEASAANALETARQRTEAWDKSERDWSDD